MSIAVVGSMNLDYVLTVAELPRRGETVVSHGFSTAPGGKGANQAAAAARLGASVAMVGRVGDDAAGRALVDSLRSFGVDTGAVEVDPVTPTGSAFITVSASGDNLLVVHRGANMELSAAQCRAHEAVIARARVLVTQLEVPTPSVLEALRIARLRGITTVLNPAPAPSGVPAQTLREVLELADFLVPNETEAASLMRLFGLERDASGDLSEPRQAIEAAHALAGLVPRTTVVVTLGRNGCVCAGTGRELVLPSFEVDAVDSTAAGDAFVGALAYSLDQTPFDLESALKFASAAGALATTRLGAQPSLPSRPEVEQVVASGRHKACLGEKEVGR